MIFSVVVTLYNRKELCLRAIQSILAQDCYDYEIIVVDDGSTDDPLSILGNVVSSYDNIYYVYQQNRGPAAAKNRGVNEANGTYIIFLDSDDYFYHEKVLTYIKNSLPADFIYFNKMLIKTKTDEIEKTSSLLSSDQLVDEMMRYPLNYAGSPPYTFLKSAFLRVGGFEPNHRWGDALLFWRLFLPSAKIKSINELGYVYDQSGDDSVSRKQDIDKLNRIFTTIESSYFSLFGELYALKYNKEWELVLLGLALLLKSPKKMTKYAWRLVKNNQKAILPAVLYILKSRRQKQ